MSSFQAGLWLPGCVTHLNNTRIPQTPTLEQCGNFKLVTITDLIPALLCLITGCPLFFISSISQGWDSPCEDQGWVNANYRVKEIKDLLWREQGLPVCLNTVLKQLHCSSSQRAGKQENPHGETKRSWCADWDTWGILEEGRIPHTTDRQKVLPQSFGEMVTFNHSSPVTAGALTCLTMLFIPMKEKKLSNTPSFCTKTKTFDTPI